MLDQFQKPNYFRPLPGNGNKASNIDDILDQYNKIIENKGNNLSPPYFPQNINMNKSRNEPAPQPQISFNNNRQNSQPINKVPENYNSAPVNSNSNRYPVLKNDDNNNMVNDKYSPFMNGQPPLSQSISDHRQRETAKSNDYTNIPQNNPTIQKNPPQPASREDLENLRQTIPIKNIVPSDQNFHHLNIQRLIQESFSTINNSNYSNDQRQKSDSMVFQNQNQRFSHNPKIFRDKFLEVSHYRDINDTVNHDQNYFYGNQSPPATAGGMRDENQKQRDSEPLEKTHVPNFLQQKPETYQEFRSRVAKDSFITSFFEEKQQEAELNSQFIQEQLSFQRRLKQQQQNQMLKNRQRQKQLQQSKKEQQLKQSKEKESYNKNNNIKNENKTQQNIDHAPNTHNINQPPYNFNNNNNNKNNNNNDIKLGKSKSDQNITDHTQGHEIRFIDLNKFDTTFQQKEQEEQRHYEELSILTNGQKSEVKKVDFETQVKLEPVIEKQNFEIQVDMYMEEQYQKIPNQNPSSHQILKETEAELSQKYQINIPDPNIFLARTTHRLQSQTLNQEVYCNSCEEFINMYRIVTHSYSCVEQKSHLLDLISLNQKLEKIFYLIKRKHDFIQFNSNDEKPWLLLFILYFEQIASNCISNNENQQKLNQQLGYCQKIGTCLPICRYTNAEVFQIYILKFIDLVQEKINLVRPKPLAIVPVINKVDVIPPQPSLKKYQNHIF